MRLFQVLFVLFVFGALAIDASPPHDDYFLDNRNCDEDFLDGCTHDIPKTKQCSGCDRARAFEAYEVTADAINFQSADPTGAVTQFAGAFAPGAVFQVGNYRVVGQENIYEAFLEYALNPGEIDIHVTTRRLHWDCNTRTLTAERTWEATLTAPRSFQIGGESYEEPGFHYSQDDCVVIYFDCNYKIVYMNEYFDHAQALAAWDPLTNLVCPPKASCSQC